MTGQGEAAPGKGSAGDLFVKVRVQHHKYFERRNRQIHSTVGINVAQARGVILLAVQQANIPIFEYKPMQVKQAVVGYGNASKHQVMDMTKRILHLEAVPKPDDAADAVAIALCHTRSSTSLLAMSQHR